VCAALAGCGRLGFDANDSSCPSNRVVNAPYAAGTGTADDPFQICSPAQLSEIASRSGDLGSRFVLMFDLDFTGVPFEGIGRMEAPFTGYLDGNGHTISNLSVTAAAGQPAGLVNAARFARIENVTLDHVTVAGSSSIGSVIGSCDNSHVRNSAVTAADIRGESSVGGLVGEALECQFIGASLSGTVEGTVDSIGGVVGSAGASAFVNIDSTIAVTAPLASSVGGVVGADVWDPVTLQNVSVQAVVVGNEEVGGIVGMNGDGSQIYRTRFDGTIRGNHGVGGFVGANYDSPFHVYSTAVAAEVVGNTGVGGFSGLHYYRTKFFDSYFTGTLAGVGSNQAGFGGFFGDVEYYGWVERSYVDVTINSSASTVGGFMGHIGYWSGNAAIYDVVNSFAAANVTGSSASTTISRWVGQNTDPNPLVGAGSYYWGGGSCVNLGGGGCGGGGMAVADLAQLQGLGGPPLSSWDFAQVWQPRSNAFPALRLEQNHAPTLTHACPGTAIVGLRYDCNLTVSDADVNEVQIAALEPSHSCAWLSPTVLALRGAPTRDHASSCTLAFSVTDGAHTTPLETVPVEVHLGVVMTPADSTGSQYFMGLHPVGSGATQVFTLTNNESVSVTGLSITGLPAGDFGFAGGAYPGTGGTCAATLGPGQTCTVAIAYTASVAGSVTQAIDLRFTAARGPVSYPFTLSGVGS